MKLMWILCLWFVSLHQIVSGDDEPASTLINTAIPDAETTTTLPSNFTTVKDTSHKDNSKPQATPAAETTAETTLATSESISVTTEGITTKGSPPEINTTLVFLTLGNQVKLIMEHFQKVNPVGFPGQEILPDPLPAPNVTESFGLVGKSEFYDIIVHGLSNFTVESVNMLLAQMTVYVQIRMKVVNILGNYTQTNVMFFTSQGPINLTLTNVTAEGIVFLEVEPDGSLHANRSVTEIKYEKVAIHVGEKNTAPLSTFVDAAGLAVVGAILPFIQARIDERLTTEVNKKLKDSPRFPALRNISPADLLVLKSREYVRKNFEPHKVQNMINFDSDYFTLSVGPVTLRGLSNFARVGDISLGMVNKTMVVKVRFVTGRVGGEGQFLLNLGKVPQVAANQRRANISIDRLQFEATLHQSLDMTQKPRLEELNLEMSPVHVQLDNNGQFNYLIEQLIYRLPDYLRYYLIDVLAEPIKKKIQKDILDEVNVEEMMAKNLPLLDKLLQENKI